MNRDDTLTDGSSAEDLTQFDAWIWACMNYGSEFGMAMDDDQYVDT